MALVVKDRVRETSTTTGTGTITLSGLVTGFQSFSVIGDGNTTYYTIVDAATGAFEVGIGTYTFSGTTLSRDVILDSSNSGSAVNFSAGLKDVFCTYPAEKSISDGKTNVIEVSSTDPALRITQTGTGNCLVVEDEANPDSSPFVVDTTGKVGIGTTTPTVPFQIAFTAGVPDASLITSDAAIITAQNTAPGFSFVVASSVASQRGVFKATRARGTLASPTAPNANDDVFSLLGSIYDGVLTRATAAINMAVDGTVSDGVAPQRITFLTGETASRLERMRITGAGDVGIGTTAPGAKLNVVANTTTDAVRITQLGTGNALVVEDSANPDLSPFVVTNNGQVLIGATTNYQLGDSSGWSLEALNSVGIGNLRTGNNAFPSSFVLAKTRATSAGSFAIVQNNDTVASIDFAADDGTDYATNAARIRVEVDGTPGTNDMPGRLVFSTTADGASTPTERMRIDNAGRVGISATPGPSTTLRVGKTITGGTQAFALNNDGAVQSDVTSSASYFRAVTSTQDAAFALPTLAHYEASQGTITGGSRTAPTNQYGYWSRSSLTGATNNYGFYGDIAAGTGRFNFYANGTAANYFEGDMQFSKTVTAGGTTGAQTINKNAGTVNFAAAATSLVVTDSRVTADSIIICTVGTNDTTLKSVAAVAGAGSFTLHANAAATAETRVNFLIIN